VAQLALARWETRQVLRWLPEGIDRQLDDGLTKTTLRAAAGYCFLKKKYRGDLGTRSLRSIMLDWVDLQGVDAANMDLAGADFNHSDLRGADLSGAVLTRGDLTGANLRRANLAGCQLANAVCAGALFEDADLTNADLTAAQFGPPNTPVWRTNVKELAKAHGWQTARLDPAIVESLET